MVVWGDKKNQYSRVFSFTYLYINLSVFSLCVREDMFIRFVQPYVNDAQYVLRQTESVSRD